MLVKLDRYGSGLKSEMSEDLHQHSKNNLTEILYIQLFSRAFADLRKEF